MRPWIAIALVTVGLVAFLPRPVSRRAEPVRVHPAPATMEVPEPEEVISLDAEIEAGRLLALAREREIERLEADYEERVGRLIESIDWSRAESRRRFPVEYELIRAEFDRLLEPP